MQSKAQTISEYILQIPAEKLDAFIKLRETILENIPEGFSEEMSYGMIGYVVPHSLYPKGYHVNPKLPLPFVNIAAQKNFIAFYHMGIYSDPELRNWFIAEYEKYTKLKPDMGKSCIRLKNYKTIPYPLIAELIRKIRVSEWISSYESNLNTQKEK
jgi:hypothetical protein